ncbi:peroxide stress protein YaaA [cf. Phormidesmis sp. LEGE 11477]|uniref:peroxide stress protein YaaA n=1 Tax=cf. Phormidesmis sp. LEGE 11477 TaxID=1828680 RepID=UPI001D15D8F0|nr:peroxide stress protein YaaA [cf. Phormidesmis sp. LEGE 11477]
MVISPAKTLDYTGVDYPDFTQPAFLDQSEALIAELRGYSQAQLSELMTISDKLAKLNYQRYQDFQTPFTPQNAKQALLVFKGDVYKGIHVEDYDEDDLSFAQDSLSILSGLYGVLRPLDLMQPYRLEMGTKLKTEKGKNLYEFWNHKISDLLNTDLAKEPQPCLVNLASNEYFKSIKSETIEARILDIDFKEKKADTYKIVAIYAKRARGLMVDFVIRNRIDNPELMKGFDSDGYSFNKALSTADHWIFCRE